MRTSRLLEQVHGLDPSTVAVFVTACLATAKAPRAGGEDQPAGPRTVSRLALAQSTGLPRETVRRKCAELVAAGLIQDYGRRGVGVSEGAALFDCDASILRRALADVHQLIETLLRIGVFAATDKTPRAS
jgi:predicted alpha/beta hydrolase